MTLMAFKEYNEDDQHPLVEWQSEVENDDQAFPRPMPHTNPDRDDMRCHCLASGVGSSPD